MSLKGLNGVQNYCTQNFKLGRSSSFIYLLFLDSELIAAAAVTPFTTFDPSKTDHGERWCLPPGGLEDGFRLLSHLIL